MRAYIAKTRGGKSALTGTAPSVRKNIIHRYPGLHPGLFIFSPVQGCPHLYIRNNNTYLAPQKMTSCILHPASYILHQTIDYLLPAADY